MVGVCIAVGVCVVGGMHGRGVSGRRGAYMAGETATAADGTHPTGMHSCFGKRIDYMNQS